MTVPESENLYYYDRDGEFYLPTIYARSPWDDAAIAGGPLSALLATGAEDAALDRDFAVARFTLDIFGKVPRKPLRITREVLREGRQTRLERVVVSDEVRPAAQAHVLRIRRTETPVFAQPHAYPPPGSLASVNAPKASFIMAGAIDHRPVIGGPGIPGRGVGWLAMNGDVVRGVRPSNFVKACLFADFGNGFGAATLASEWSFANLDITMQFLRMPVGDWFLIDAETHMAGNGHGTARNIFADEQGVYARGFQTVFVAPGHQSKSVPISLG